MAHEILPIRHSITGAAPWHGIGVIPDGPIRFVCSNALIHHRAPQYILGACPIPAIERMSDEDLDLSYYRVYWRMRRVFAGGDCYGIDRATMMIVAPRWMSALDRIVTEIRRRRDERED